MTCRDFDELMADYCSGELPADARARSDQHLATCRTCPTYLRQYQAVIRMVREAMRPSESPLPDDQFERLVQAILTARRG